MPPVVVDPGFEVVGGGGVWIIEVVCQNNGVAWNNFNPHSGLQAIALNSRILFGETICSKIYQDVAGWELGAQYILTVWKRTLGAFPRDTSLLIGSTSFQVGVISGFSASWTLHTFPAFTAFEDPMRIAFFQPAGVSTQNFQRNLDDIVVTKLIPPEKGIPAGRGSRGILDPQSVDASFQAQGPKGILVPQGPSATLTPLFVKGKPGKVS